MASKQSEACYRITLQGIVQGVGFRPFVYREAKRLGIRGKVWNQNGDVIILASGGCFPDFLDRIKQNSPPGSWVENITTTPILHFEAEGFTIANSYASSQNESRLFPPDIALCKGCYGEIVDAKNRRAGHYFNNCITCGPRFSILEAFPYDRPNTSMSAFALCENCLNEYNSPDDPRYHAETVCCHGCGPVLHYRRGDEFYTNNDAFVEALQDLPGGIAIKGIGGYHLACCPYDKDALQSLRQLKARESKPFALMFRDMATISHICELSNEERDLLASPARPIVLLKMKNNPFSQQVFGDADGRCGCFLPYTSLQAMLLAEMPCIVMTSANLSASPMIKDETDIFALTKHVLYHNRKIIRGIEDSVLQITASKKSFIRRGRGFVPLPITITCPDASCKAETAPLPVATCASNSQVEQKWHDNIQLLAAGGDLKASFGLLKNKAFILSQPYSDLENEQTFNQFKEGLFDYENIFAVKPHAIICDAHPRYFSSELAKNLATDRSIPLIKVYHHHAHIASVMAEHKLSKILGVAMDGAGYGQDGNIWGGEFLLCNEGNCRRVGHLAYTKMTAGDTAQKDAAKTAACYLYKYGLPSSHPQRTIIEAALKHNINIINTSSMGRLFDAVSAILDICHTNSYESECAIRLQYAAEEEAKTGIPPLDMFFDIQTKNGMYIAHFNDVMQKCLTKTQGAALGFHNAVSCMITEICSRVANDNNIRDIALSGGVFQNSLLLEKVTASLTTSGFNVYTNELVPSNDGGLALGQAYIGIRHLIRNSVLTL